MKLFKIERQDSGGYDTFDMADIARSALNEGG